MKKIVKMITAMVIGGVIMVPVTAAIFFSIAPQIGGESSGKRLERMKQSSNYQDGKFRNTVATNMDMSFDDMAKTTWEMIKGDETRTPAGEIKTQQFDQEKFLTAEDTEIVISWFGHSTVLIKMDGKVILADPVFSERASMFSFIGPKRYTYSNPMNAEQLPDIDFVIISHDHYDHLDYETITALKNKVGHFYVPLGVGAHIEKWGVSVERITEMDWWDEAVVDGKIELAFTPSRHFSGRAFTDRFNTLWGSWVVKGKKQRLFFGGDSGYFPGFREIGEKYGPFDITMLECGQYNERWANIHMMPEETVQAHLDLKGKVLMPIHWGKFTLALHPWKEPVERVSAAAEKHGVQLATMISGSQMIVYSNIIKDRWWVEYN